MSAYQNQPVAGTEQLDVPRESQADRYATGAPLVPGAIGFPAVTPNANLGSTASATVRANSADYAGIISLVSSGTGQASGVQCAVVFGVALPATPKSVQLTHGAVVAGAPTLAATSITATGFNITMLAAPTAATTYLCCYAVFQ